MAKYFLAGMILLALEIHAQRIPKLGMVSTVEMDSLLYASGFRYLGTSVQSLLAPTISDNDFQMKLKHLRELKCELLMCNILFPGAVKIAGPEVDKTKVLTYLESVLIRAKQAGIHRLILGSAGARRLPDNYDQEKAKADFVELCKAMAPLARKYDVTIILENLNHTETNFINRVSEAADIVRKVNHKNFRLNADIYHMKKENESPDEIIAAGGYIVYCEIAEVEKRTLPGIMGDDFLPYLRALRKINYSGPILIEGNSENPKSDFPKAYQYLTGQLQMVYGRQ